MLAEAKKLAKNSTLALLHRTGLLRSYLERRLADRAVVLTYHRVLPDALRNESFSADGIVVTPETFRLHMQTLAASFRPLHVSEFAEALEHGPLPRGACLVTFDDGWWDNLEYALPVLEEFKVPALVFVATDYIGTTRCFWQEQLSRMLFSLWQHGKTAQDTLRSLGVDCGLEESPATARVRIRELVTRFKSKPAADIDRYLRRVEAAIQESTIGETNAARIDRFMSWAEVARLSESGLVTIGSHCCSHTPLTKLSMEAANQELLSSRDLIASKLGTTPADLAYPNGDCTEEIAALAIRAGYRTAFTTERGHIGTGANAGLLPRMNIHEGSTSSEASFRARIAGLI